MLHARRTEPARPLKVLIVDESYLTRRTLQARLCNREVHLYHCSRAEEAVATAADYTPDYILIDHALSATHPLALQRALATDPDTACVPVVFIAEARDDVAATLGDCISLDDNGLERLLGFE